MLAEVGGDRFPGAFWQHLARRLQRCEERTAGQAGRVRTAQFPVHCERRFRSMVNAVRVSLDRGGSVVASTVRGIELHPGTEIGDGQGESRDACGL